MSFLTALRADTLQTLTFKLIPKIDDALKGDVIKWSAFYEHRIKMGSVSISYFKLSTLANDRRNTYSTWKHL